MAKARKRATGGGRAPARGRLTGVAADRAEAVLLEQLPMVVRDVHLWKVDQLRLLDRNPRTHSDEQVNQIAASMKAFGFTWPIMVNARSRRIVAGNGRYLAALQLGLAAVPVVEEDHLTPAQRRAFIIADNKIALNAGWATDVLAGDFLALKGLGLETLTGFSDQEIVDVLASLEGDAGAPKEDPIPRVPTRPTTRAGDLWLLGPHRVLCGDATVIQDLSRALDGEPADCVWTDPPYNVDYDGPSAGRIKNDCLSPAAFADLLRKALVGAFTVLRPGAPIYLAHADTAGLAVRTAFAEAGFRLSSCLIWRKNVLVLGRGDYHWQHEPILYGWKPGATHRWYGERDKTTILEFDAPPFLQVAEDEWQIAMGERTLVVRGAGLTIEAAQGTVLLEDKPHVSAEHPTMKPVALVSRMLANSTRAGHRVLDPFGGSGSTLIACQARGLRASTVELEPRFCDVIVRRWQNLTGKQATLAGRGIPFDEAGGKRRRRRT